MSNLNLVSVLFVFGNSFAQTPVDINLPNFKTAANNVYEVVRDYQNDNYYNNTGVYVIKNKNLNSVQLESIKNSDEMKKAISTCLYNTDEATYEQFLSKVESSLSAFGKIEWESDLNSFEKENRNWDALKNIKQARYIYSKTDETGGPGSYFPKCSLVAKTSLGFSFAFHAIDTY